MQVLANALPGFRDLRAPVIAGYMWLLLAYLVVQPDFNHRPHGDLAASVYDLGKNAGRVWTVIAFGVIAYLAGSVSQDLSRLLHIAVRDTRIWALISRNFSVGIEDQLIPMLNRGESELRRAMHSEKRKFLDFQKLDEGLHEAFMEARLETERELELPATLLIDDRSELFAEVDRLRAEGDLRMAVAPPLIALTIFLVFSSSWWWLVLLLPSAALFFQGVQRDLDSKKIIADAIRIGRIKSSSVEKFSQWVNQTFLKEFE